MIGRASFYGNPFIGLFAAANDKIAIVPPGSPQSFVSGLSENLDVSVVETRVSESNLLGIYLCMNNRSLIVEDSIADSEKRALESTGLDVIYMKERHNAWGNNLCINSKGGIINDNVPRAIIKTLEDRLGIEIVPMSIDGYQTVGSVVIATEKGFAIKNKASEDTIRQIESILKVKGGVSTANMGNMFVSVCALANSSGLVVGETTTGIEISRLQDALNVG
jgi:translation initiation factor 6